VNFDDSQEEQDYLPLLNAITPLQELASVTGFREEIQVGREDDSLYVTLPLGYEPKQIDAIKRKLQQYGITIVDREKLLYARIPIDGITKDELERGQSKIAAVRLFFQAAAMSEGLQGVAAAAEGLDTIMNGL